MISEATTQLLQKLFQVQNTYQPAPAIIAQLSSKSLLMFVGATCVGKNTVMQSVAGSDPRFGVSGTFTTRPPREDDNPKVYTYYEHSDEGLEPILSRIAKREVVNYAINPHSLLLYGTELSDYPYEYNLKDIFSSAITGFRQLGFKQTLAVTVITQPEIWLQRFEARFPVGHPQREARRDEAIDSFSWSLGQTGADHLWVENIDGQPELAAQLVLDACLQGGTGQPEARKLAEASLEAAEQIQL